jgi:hypothetical protein
MSVRTVLLSPLFQAEAELQKSKVKKLICSRVLIETLVSSHPCHKTDVRKQNTVLN